MLQEDRVLRHLKEDGGLTSMQAFKLYDVTRLAAVVFNLRKKGYNIVSVKKDCYNKFGELTVLTEYRLAEEELWKG